MLRFGLAALKPQALACYFFSGQEGKEESLGPGIREYQRAHERRLTGLLELGEKKNYLQKVFKAI